MDTVRGEREERWQMNLNIVSEPLAWTLTEDLARTVLAADKGSTAQLISWDVVDFTEKGDNYTCVVSSVKVSYKLEGEDHNISYITKTNTHHCSKGFNDIIQFITQMEVNFYEELLPALNSELLAAGQPALQVARHVYTYSEGDIITIFMEDLRERGFKMHSRHQGLDAAHTSLVVQELARLHAASLLLQGKLPDNSLTNKYEYLQKKWPRITKDAADFTIKFEKGHINNIVLTLDKVGGYSVVIKWLHSLESQIIDILEGPKDSSQAFTVLCHGDCWINNLLFRYSEDGVPMEVMLLDLQLVSNTSLGHDLNYLLFTSLEGSVRSKNLNIFMDTYYNVLTKVAMAGDLPVPFTLQQLGQEYQNCHPFGALLAAAWVVPMILSNAEDSPELKDLTDEKMTEFLEKQKETLLNNLLKSPMLGSRILSIFDDMLECGVIN